MLISARLWFADLLTVSRKISLLALSFDRVCLNSAPETMCKPLACCDLTLKVLKVHEPTHMASAVSSWLWRILSDLFLQKTKTFLAYFHGGNFPNQVSFQSRVRVVSFVLPLRFVQGWARFGTHQYQISGTRCLLFCGVRCLFWARKMLVSSSRLASVTLEALKLDCVALSLKCRWQLSSKLLQNLLRFYRARFRRIFLFAEVDDYEYVFPTRPSAVIVVCFLGTSMCWISSPKTLQRLYWHTKRSFTPDQLLYAIVRVYSACKPFSVVWSAETAEPV